MEQSKQQRIRELTDRLNRCRYEYYNPYTSLSLENAPKISS